MTNTNKALYDEWSATYDAVENKTRDLEREACRNLLGGRKLGRVVELGCGTGKNTAWLAANAEHVTAVDLSPEMQLVAREKAAAENVDFAIADISRPWEFPADSADTITSSLVLEHIEDLGHIFAEAAKTLKPAGTFYVCELHPFKQYSGSKARFETAGETKVLDCYTHHISDYLTAANANGFRAERLDEWFDDGDRTSVPRLVSFLFNLR